MAGLFIGFLVEKCAACQSHRKSDFGWIAFTHFPLLNAYYKEGSKKSQAILMAFRSCILTGKPELLLYLMFFVFFSGFLKSIVVSAPSLYTRQWSDLQSGLTSCLQIFKKSYHSFRIISRFWLAKSTRIIHHNHLLITTFGRILRLMNRWRQKCSFLAG